MSAVEKLHAAIERLEALRGEQSAGRWQRMHSDRHLVWAEGEVVVRVLHPDDAELIVTLHRTIDAQLAVLRDAHERYSRNPEKEPVSPSGKNAVALADAILGGAS